MRPNWFVKQPWLSNVELQCGGGGNSEEVREELTSEVVQKKWHTVVSCLITNDSCWKMQQNKGLCCSEC